MTGASKNKRELWEEGVRNGIWWVSFPQREFNIWNSLPEMVESDTITTFNNHLGGHVNEQRVEGCRSDDGLLIDGQKGHYGHDGPKGLFLCCTIPTIATEHITSKKRTSIFKWDQFLIVVSMALMAQRAWFCSVSLCTSITLHSCEYSVWGRSGMKLIKSYKKMRDVSLHHDRSTRSKQTFKETGSASFLTTAFGVRCTAKILFPNENLMHFTSPLSSILWNEQQKKFFAGMNLLSSRTILWRGLEFPVELVYPN